MGDEFNKWNIWNGKLENPAKEFVPISIVTTVMNRTNDLEQTLYYNVMDNRDYPEIEFVVLDYNTTKGKEVDRLRKTVKEISDKTKAYIYYYRTEDPEYYSMSHSRNMAFRLAQNDIVNSVDADNYVFKCFASYINILANQTDSDKLIFSKGKRLAHGRVGFYREPFLYEMGGYSEGFGTTYGYEDKDLVRRATILRNYLFMYYGGKFCDRLKNSKGKSVENMTRKDWKKTEEENKKLSQYYIDNEVVNPNLNEDDLCYCGVGTCYDWDGNKIELEPYSIEE